MPLGTIAMFASLSARRLTTRPGVLVALAGRTYVCSRCVGCMQYVSKQYRVTAAYVTSNTLPKLLIYKKFVVNFGSTWFKQGAPLDYS